ncbi:hypothetical protein ACFTY8_38995 [Streptomyces mirabilis]|uniref:hypothetical protein n=1 Tax=Streptomyces mirabilis TaxID=68239 RepID=UPI003641B868
MDETGLTEDEVNDLLDGDEEMTGRRARAVTLPARRPAADLPRYRPIGWRTTSRAAA